MGLTEEEYWSGLDGYDSAVDFRSAMPQQNWEAIPTSYVVNKSHEYRMEHLIMDITMNSRKLGSRHSLFCQTASWPHDKCELITKLH